MMYDVYMILTKQMGRDGAFEIDVLGAIVVIQLSTHEGMQVQVEGLQLLEQAFQVLLEGWRIVPGTPFSPSVGKAWRHTNE